MSAPLGATPAVRSSNQLWHECTHDAEAIEERVVELAENGHSPSEIGLKLRDEGLNGTPVPDVTLATDKKMTEIPEERDAEPGERPAGLTVYNQVTNAISIVEVASDEDPSVESIAGLVREVAVEHDHDPAVELVENPRGDDETLVSDFPVDTTRAREQLGWAPQRSVEETVRDLFERRA